jgi:lipopolysaccharide transport system ATP-binding protein
VIAIRCENIGKKYRIGRQQRYRTLRDTISEIASAPFQKLASRGENRSVAKDLDLWALKDICLEVNHGEVLGIIGRNGSGKSTLLKILSRITRPTVGSAEIYGRVGTLLEVGAGFHPELSGRENIQLYGAVLGMSRLEIASKFEEIVEFAECGRLLDTAIKHYSSGMYVRLAFAVAAHLETEILLVDEALAVGDAVFQKKCLGKMSEVAHQGRTVLFVSHNLLAIESLCTRAICLHEGKIVLEGATGLITSRYLQTWLPTFSEVVYDDVATAPGNDLIRLRRASVRPVNGTSRDRLTIKTPLTVEFEYWKFAESTSFDLGVSVLNEHDINVFTTVQFAGMSAQSGLLRSSFVVPADLMNDGTYRIHLLALQGSTTVVAGWEDVVTFKVNDAPSDLRGLYHDLWPGAVRPNFQWETERLGPLPTTKQ